MTILAFDDRRGLYELENVLKELLGGKMHFMGFDSAEKVLRAAEKNGYDISLCRCCISESERNAPARRAVISLSEDKLYWYCRNSE